MTWHPELALTCITSGFLEGRTDGVIATPAVAEKGHFDLRMVVSSAGGHSSVPPEHTVSSSPCIER